MSARYLRKTALLGGVLFLSSLILGAAAQAAQPPGAHLNVTEVFVDIPNSELVISGTDLGFGPGPLVVTLGEVGPLAINNATDTQIVAQLPAVPFGDYLLTVSRGNGQSQNDEYDLTIGAVGLLAAHVNSLGNGSGVGLNSVSKLSTGKYLLTFNQNIQFCHRVASLGSQTYTSIDTSFDGVPGEIYHYKTFGAEELVVVTYDSAGNKADRNFHVLVWCD